MDKNSKEYKKCVEILKEELVPAFGCTEPIAIAYASAIGRKYLGKIPESVFIELSGSIVKNAKSVIIPNTGGLRGIEAAAASGIIAGNPEEKLEVIKSITDKQRERIAVFLKKTEFKIKLSDSQKLFFISVVEKKEDCTVRVSLADRHTNVVLIEKNGETVLSEPSDESEKNTGTDEKYLNMKNIFEFAGMVDDEDVFERIETQKKYNMSIAEAGLQMRFGADIGNTVLRLYPDSLYARCAAMAAAGSDARMNGCELPVIINSGSGNQGITVSVPVIVYAMENSVEKERLYRALVLSNLISIYQKKGIGRLSAFCGAVNAGTAAACGIAYLEDGSLDAVSHTLVNSLATISGMVCDGAKSSCAGKIALSVQAGLMGFEMYKYGREFLSGDGIITKGADNTISNISRLGRIGMFRTDQEILQIMTEQRGGR